MRQVAYNLTTYLGAIMKISNLIPMSLCATLFFLSACGPKPNNSSPLDQINQNKISGNITGGKNATLEFQKANGIVAIRIKGLAIGANGIPVGTIGLCTGTLIEQDIIVTAAHCFMDPTIRQILISFVTDIKAVNKDNTLDASDVLINGDYHSVDAEKGFAEGDPSNDIAIIKLRTPAPSDYKPAKLPSADFALTVKNKLILSGYGANVPVLNELVTDPVSGVERIVAIKMKDSGTGTLRTVTDVTITKVTADNKEIVITEAKGTRGACHGDSGGPAYVKQSDGSLILIGVTSRGTSELGNCNESGVFTNMVGHLDWIKTTIAELRSVK